MRLSSRQAVRSLTPCRAASACTKSVTSVTSPPATKSSVTELAVEVSAGPTGEADATSSQHPVRRPPAEGSHRGSRFGGHSPAPRTLRARPDNGRTVVPCLRADIDRRGLLVPLDISSNKTVLDGVARLRAARELRIAQVPVRVVAPDDEVEYMLLAGLERRQLTASQRAALALELAQYREARDAGQQRQLANLRNQSVEGSTLPPRGKTREQAASWASVSPRTVQDAKRVQDADPELFEQIRQGRIPADKAARRVRQRQRDAELPPPPPLPSGPFELIYADPPWRLPGSSDGSRSIENHYPTMPLAEIAAMQLPAADDAVLYLWAVPSLLPQALEVMSAWGFSYRGEQVWVKDKIGLGAWNRNQHEPLLVGVRGNFKPPETDRRFPSVIQHPRGAIQPSPRRCTSCSSGPTRAPANWSCSGAATPDPAG
jgi:hypothetical protein